MILAEPGTKNVPSALQAGFAFAGNLGVTTGGMTTSSIFFLQANAQLKNANSKNRFLRRKTCFDFGCAPFY
jgi:hypothetical protein